MTGIASPARRRSSTWEAAAVTTAILCCIPGSAAGLSTTTLSRPCIVDRIVVDPDDKIDVVEPGCSFDLEVQTFGPGGEFDVWAEDDAGGGGSARGGDPVSAYDGSRFVIDYRAGDNPASDEIEITVVMDPHSPDFVCTGAARGDSGEKTFPVAASATDCAITFRVVDEIDLGALQFSVDYAASDANFPGCRLATTCVSKLNDRPETAVPSDDNDARRLTLRMESARGFSAPVDVYRCEFRVEGTGGPPAPEEFVVTATSARTPQPLSKPVLELPRIEATIDCDLSSSTTTTTLPFVAAECGRPCSPESPAPKASDALFVLATAVGSGTCKTCICDVNRSGQVDATDALTVLKRVVGLDAFMRCVRCASAVPPGCGN